MIHEQPAHLRGDLQAGFKGHFRSKQLLGQGQELASLRRTNGKTTYDLTYDADNRMSTVKIGGIITAILYMMGMATAGGALLKKGLQHTKQLLRIEELHQRYER